jgi:hypothetical protein
MTDRRQKTWTPKNGPTINERDAARLAEEFERDDHFLVDAEVTFPRRAGRPSLSGSGVVSPQVTFRLSPELRAAAEELAAERGTTVSVLAREALEDLGNR